MVIFPRSLPIQFPYGLSDFSKIILGGYFYQDRTDRIPLLETVGDQLIFICPRRFGKSLLLSMLERYTDSRSVFVLMIVIPAPGGNPGFRIDDRHSRAGGNLGSR